MDKELLEKVKETKTVDELKALLNTDEDNAGKLYSLIHSGEELSDEVLMSLAAGFGSIDIGMGGVDMGVSHTKKCPKCGTVMQVSKSGSGKCPSCGYGYSLGSFKF